MALGTMGRLKISELYTRAAGDSFIAAPFIVFAVSRCAGQMQQLSIESSQMKLLLCRSLCRDNYIPYAGSDSP